MANYRDKLRPDQDLQCYFERPSAIAAMHHASESGFQVSGTWRQQFDWAVIEWNRDNVIEHPRFRNLPDGDLRGLELTYEESRTNCIPLDSDLYPTVDWPFLRIWADEGGVEEFYRVPLKDYAVPVSGSYTAAQAELELTGTPVSGDYVGISILGEHHTHQLYGVDTLETAVQAVVDSINSFSGFAVATRNGAKLQVYYVGEGQTLATSTVGANGNRIGVYGFVAGSGSMAWSPWWQRFSGGVSPDRWQVTLPFDSLVDETGRAVLVHEVRKMRWTYAAELQLGAFERSEFDVAVSGWSVTGAGRRYRVAGPGTQRVEDDSPEAVYSGSWSEAKGNFSGGTIHFTTETSAAVTCSYRAVGDHELFLGTRSSFNGGGVSVWVDEQLVKSENLYTAGEDVLRRVPIGSFGAGIHSVRIEHTGSGGSYLYFDFLEATVPCESVPTFPADNKVTLATDWDTDHSLAVPAERTVAMIHELGFHGRVNHYVGALWFYELYRPGHQYASGTVDFVGTPAFSQTTELRIGRTDQPPELDAIISHVNRIGDTAETIAKAFELEINRGYTAVRAEASGNRLTIFARAMGTDGNLVTIAATPASGDFAAVASGPTLDGGTNGDWRTDLNALPRINRAARDWSEAFYAAVKSYGMDVTAAFSMELQHGDPSLDAGVAQRYPNGDPAWLNTPALQTNFSPTSTDFWKEVYCGMADVMAAAGCVPYLQFGEVQWWYFPLAGAGMPFYDDYTLAEFQNRYGRELSVFPTNDADPAAYPEEVEFLPSLIGEFTNAVIAHVRSSHPGCRFETLYPTDVNETAFNTAINYPAAAWTPDRLDNLKTESFTYTYTRNLDRAFGTISHGALRGFTPSRRSFLVGIADSKTAWLKEVHEALAQNVESIVLFALDQYCLIGYDTPLPTALRRNFFCG